MQTILFFQKGSNLCIWDKKNADILTIMKQTKKQQTHNSS